MRYTTYQAGDGDARTLHSPLNDAPTYRPETPTFNSTPSPEARVGAIAGLLAIVAGSIFAIALVVRAFLEPIIGYDDNYRAIYGTTPTTELLTHIAKIAVLICVALIAVWCFTYKSRSTKQ